MENRCVMCGCYIPEGDHVCKFCRENILGDYTIEDDNVIVIDNTTVSDYTIVDDNTHAIKLEIQPNIVSIDTTVNTIEFGVESTFELLVLFAKYYIFKTNMNSYGTFNIQFIQMNVQENEDLLSCETRLYKEYNRTVELIESMIVKK